MFLFIIDKEQYKIQNNPSNSKSRKKATRRQNCAQSVTSDGISFCHLCVHITKACIHAADCALCRTENFITTIWCFPIMQYLSTETTGGKKKSAQIKGTLFKNIFSPIPLRSLSASADWFQMIENTLMEQWLKTSYYYF